MNILYAVDAGGREWFLVISYQQEKILNSVKETKAVVQSKDSREDLCIKSVLKSGDNSSAKRHFSLDICGDCPFREICFG